MKKQLALFATILALQGCHAQIGTPEGFRAYGETLNGLNTERRGLDFHQTRRYREAQETNRKSCGWIGKLSEMAGGQPCTGTAKSAVKDYTDTTNPVEGS